MSSTAETPQPAPAPTPTPTVTPVPVQNPLTLVMELNSPTAYLQITGLLGQVQSKLNETLDATQLVHFARFVFLENNTKFAVITSYDGTLAAYVQAFVDYVGDIFDGLLQFVKNPPPLPVQQYPQEFLAFVTANNVPIVSQFYSAYPTLTVLQIKANEDDS